MATTVCMVSLYGVSAPESGAEHSPLLAALARQAAGERTKKLFQVELHRLPERFKHLLGVILAVVYLLSVCLPRLKSVCT